MEILIYLMSLEQFSFGDASQEFLRWDEEKLPFFSRQILKQTIILCKHIGDQLPCHIPMARITNEISTAHPLAGGICKDDIHAYKLMLLAVTVVLRDDIVRMRILLFVGEFKTLSFLRPMYFSCIPVGSVLHASRP